MQTVASASGSLYQREFCAASTENDIAFAGASDFVFYIHMCAIGYSRWVAEYGV